MNKTFTFSKYYFNSLGTKVFLLFLLSNFYLVNAQATLPFYQDFEGSYNWTLVNGTQTNKWIIAKRDGSSTELFITNDSGKNNNYSDLTSVVHAYRDVAIPTNVSLISIGYAYNVRGNTNDYFRVWLVPQSYTPVAGTLISASSDRILFKSKQTTGGGWTNLTPENVNVSSFSGSNMRLVFEWVNNQDGTVNNNAVAIDNIDLKILCSGNPTPGNTFASVNPVNSGSTTVLSLQNASVGTGVTYQWQKSTDGISYANIAGATANTYTATITAKTFFKCVVTCSGNSGKSNPIEVKLPYCRPTSSSNSTYINNFSTDGGVTNISSLNTGYSNNGYQNFYDANLVSINSGNDLTVNFRLFGGTAGVSIWVDWNKDNIFDNASERIIKTNGYLSSGYYSATINVPNKPPGDYRLRIVTDYNNVSPDACILAGTTMRGEGEDYKLQILTPSPCSGSPNAGTVLLTPSSGVPSSNFIGTVTGGTTGVSGLTYQWQIADTAGGTFVNIPGATEATANLRSIATPSVTKYYRRQTICTGSGSISNSVAQPYTNLLTPTYCSGTITTKKDLYIGSFQFVGTLNDNPSPNISTTDTGYSNYTNQTPVVEQPQGSVINVVAKAFSDKLGVIAEEPGFWKAWVDWNGDGVFSDTSEEVYALTALSTESLTFGFVIPSTAPVGIYKMRIKVSTNSALTACSNGNKGETEDYSFKVIFDCPAKIITATLADGERCGTGSVILTATPKRQGDVIRWYAAASGGSILYTGENFTTSLLENTRTTYYVVASDGICESAFRIPVTAIANSGPTVDFSIVQPFCTATTDGQVITAASDKRIDVLLDEKFDSGLGSFIQSPTETGYQNIADTYWINRPSPYKPASTTDNPPGSYQGLSPALSSGYFSENFAMTNADYDRGGQLMNRLTLNENLDTRNLDNLTLEFDLYYFTIITSADAVNYFSIDYSLNGTTWVTLKTIYDNQGNPNIWKKISLSTLNTVASGNNLPADLLNKTTLKFRLSSFSFAKESPKLFKESIAAVDNVKVFGLKDESSLFGWTSTTPGILYKENCSTPLAADMTAAKICIKPTDIQIENNTQFSITAQAIFTNGCPAIGTTIMRNDAKIYKMTASTNWNTSGNWLPNDNLVPDITKCVIIKQPVVLNLGADGFAKNVTVEIGGSLQIMAPKTLTINEYIRNNAGADKVLLESDANLIQQKSSSVNVGPLTAKRALTGLRNGPTYIDYVYWSSPVAGQLTKGSAPGAFSPGTPPSSFFSYRESNDQFYETADLEFIPGKGYAVEAEVGISAKTYTFKGVPNNGNKSINIKRSANTLEGSPPVTYIHGYNLVGNPYPSNISFDKLYDGNSALIYKTAWFWTNNKIYTPQQMGSQYEGNNYAIYNATGGNSAAYTVSTGSTYSEGFIKVGQAFIVQNKQQENSNSDLIFTNDMRVSDPGQFFSKGTSEKNRFWVTLTNPANVVNSQLIGYMDGASDGFEQDFDAESFGDYSDLFYSKLDDMKLVIQGRNQNFTTSDKVNLGAVISQNGVYTISLNKAEGIFGKTQKIYLKDKIAGVVTDLKTNDYSFTTNKGISEGRFEIIYKIDAVLAIDEVHKENIVVYREANTFGIKATQKILEVEMFDYAGRLIAKLQPLSTSSKIPADSLPNGIYLLQIKLANGDTITKKIRK